MSKYNNEKETVKYLNTIFNELTISPKGIELIKEFISNEDCVEKLENTGIGAGTSQMLDFLAILANSTDKEQHQIVLEFLKSSQNVKPSKLATGIVRRYTLSKNTEPELSILTTPSREIQKFILEHIDINNHTDATNILKIVKNIPKEYFKNERFRKQVYATDVSRYVKWMEVEKQEAIDYMHDYLEQESKNTNDLH